MRLNLFYTFNFQLPELKKISDPRQIMRFKWDEPLSGDGEIHIPTADEWEEMDRRLADLHLEKPPENLPKIE